MSTAIRKRKTQTPTAGEARIEFAGGFVQFITPPTDSDAKVWDDVRARQASIRTALPKIHGRRSGETTHRVPAYRDAGKARTLDQVVTDIAALSDAKDVETVNRKAGGYMTGYAITHTDGHFAVLRPTPTPDGKPAWGTPTWIGAIDQEHWRAYATVRTLRPRGSKRDASWVTWMLTGDRLTFDAVDGEGDSASAWAPAWFELGLETGNTLSVTLDDKYAWPLRGIAWRVGYVPMFGAPCGALVLDAADGSVRVVVAGKAPEKGAK